MLKYDDYRAGHPLFQLGADQIVGTRTTVMGDRVYRLEDGRIAANLEVLGAHETYNQLNKAAGLTVFEFKTSDEYVSRDRERPTIFENIVLAHLEKGQKIPPNFPAMRQFNSGGGEISFPGKLKMSAVTKAVGFIEGDRFLGTFSMKCLYEFSDLDPQTALILPAQSMVIGEGTFDIRLRHS